MKKADYLIGLVIAIIALGAFGVSRLFISAKDNLSVTIESAGTVIYKGELAQDKEFMVETGSKHNLVVVKDGKVSVTEADCKDLLCKKRGEIKMAGESIICLPHRLIITINSLRPDVDAVSQ